MYPHERSLVKRLEGKPFAIIGVNSDDDLDKLKKVLEKEQITWRSFYDGSGGPIAEAWDISSWPSVFVIDHKGVIRFEGVRGKDLDQAVDQLLKEADK